MLIFRHGPYSCSLILFSLIQSYKATVVIPLLLYMALSQTPLPEYVAYITVKVNVSDSEKPN